MSRLKSRAYSGYRLTDFLFEIPSDADRRTLLLESADRLFTAMDTEKRGSLSVSELKTRLSSVRWCLLSEMDISGLLEKMECDLQDEDAKICCGEFCSAFLQYTAPIADRLADEFALRNLDSDNAPNQANNLRKADFGRSQSSRDLQATPGLPDIFQNPKGKQPPRDKTNRNMSYRQRRSTYDVNMLTQQLAEGQAMISKQVPPVVARQRRKTSIMSFGIPSASVFEKPARTKADTRLPQILRPSKSCSLLKTAEVPYSSPSLTFEDLANMYKLSEEFEHGTDQDSRDRSTVRLQHSGLYRRCMGATHDDSMAEGTQHSDENSIRACMPKQAHDNTTQQHPIP